MAENEKYTLPDYKKFTCLGDSITQGFWDEEGLGWVARLRQKVAKDAPCQYWFGNSGISGDTIRDAWHNLQKLMHQAPQNIIIKIGVNDTCIYEGADGVEHQRILAHERMSVWDIMTDFLLKQDVNLLVVGPLPVEKDITYINPKPCDAGVLKGRRFENALIKDYNDAQQALCQAKDILFLRLYEHWDKIKDQGFYFDGLHPNAKGHQLLADQIYARLKADKLIS